jgi:hypothetical protein
VIACVQLRRASVLIPQYEGTPDTTADAIGYDDVRGRPSSASCRSPSRQRSDRPARRAHHQVAIVDVLEQLRRRVGPDHAPPATLGDLSRLRTRFMAVRYRYPVGSFMPPTRSPSLHLATNVSCISSSASSALPATMNSARNSLKGSRTMVRSRGPRVLVTETAEDVPPMDPLSFRVPSR